LGEEDISFYFSFWIAKYLRKCVLAELSYTEMNKIFMFSYAFEDMNDIIVIGTLFLIINILQVVGVDPLSQMLYYSSNSL